MEVVLENLPQWAYVVIAILGTLMGGGGLVAWYQSFKKEARTDKEHIAQLYKEYIEELKEDHEALKASVTAHQQEYLACRVENAELKLIIKQMEKKGE